MMPKPLAAVPTWHFQVDKQVYFSLPRALGLIFLSGKRVTTRLEAHSSDLSGADFFSMQMEELERSAAC